MPRFKQLRRSTQDTQISEQTQADSCTAREPSTGYECQGDVFWDCSLQQVRFHTGNVFTGCWGLDVGACASRCITDKRVVLAISWRELLELHGSDLACDRSSSGRLHQPSPLCVMQIQVLQVVRTCISYASLLNWMTPVACARCMADEVCAQHKQFCAQAIRWLCKSKICCVTRTPRGHRPHSAAAAAGGTVVGVSRRSPLGVGSLTRLASKRCLSTFIDNFPLLPWRIFSALLCVCSLSTC